MDAKFVVSLKAMIRSVRVSNDLAMSSLIIDTTDTSQKTDYITFL